jgi:hypothetical protein
MMNVKKETNEIELQNYQERGTVNVHRKIDQILSDVCVNIYFMFLLFLVDALGFIYNWINRLKG